jgi:hypothetical protein
LTNFGVGSRVKSRRGSHFCRALSGGGDEMLGMLRCVIAAWLSPRRAGLE